ncbi:molybdopterin-guanine dinucleotide biosynthesis protein MobA [Photobacterium proteolyticum]|uniref:Molybdopterin-guanine dinucleotide biosynthesis protein MobA n=1 Tax=Photobacterium proteolyticum TaxID=1903952 RepID=A0A1Q9GJW0_9GAMM|nr:selenium cofactor biosynthesis protein YqeC [Photobacterium proteolyticum]OLQ74791.1 molybdopterin-guanine dinucleotide biosynthesis protein MobA [Photobacterium proteolyticum]
MKSAKTYHALRASQFDIPLNNSLVIALVGGGGKTSTAFWLARQFKTQGHCVFVSTTTKMYLPENNQADNFINLESSINPLIPYQHLDLSEPSITFCYKDKIISNNKSDKIKVSGVTAELIDKLKNDSPFTVFIIESDGAKCLPIKAPDRHEPCIPITSDMVIGITGAEVIHTQATPERIHRWNTFSALTQCSTGDIIDHRVLGNLIEHQHGMFKHAPDQAIKIWLINKIDLTANYPNLTRLAHKVINKTTTLDAIWLAAMNSQTPIKDVLTRGKP